ncbi:CASH domain-dontaining protein [Methanophagales archaeon]|nr:CASH domain-dontaining protein [Methanophagales archaeon]
MNDMTKMGWFVRHVKIALAIAILCFCIGQITAIPQQDYTLYGTATLEGTVLTAQDGAVISLAVDGVELESYTMGDIPGTDYYVLKVPLDSDPGVTTVAQEGDTAYIYINGTAINEGPQIIGAPSTTARFDISAIAAISASIFQDNFDNYITGTFPSSGGWQLIYSGYGKSFQIVDNTQCVSAPNSLKLEVGSDCTAKAYHQLNQTPNLVSYVADVMVRQQPESSVQDYGNVSLALSNPNIVSEDRIGQVTFDHAENRAIQPGNIPYNFGVWYHINVTVDMKKRVYDVFVDDQLVASRINMGGTGNYTGFCVEAGNNTQVWVDNIKVVASGADMITVDSGGGADYTHIQDAVDNARSGSTIKVLSGTYNEHVLITKPLKLIGASRNITIIDGGGTGECVHVTADNVEISGFTIKNSTYGLYLDSSNNCILDNNIICSCGIHLSSSHNNVISDNEIVENDMGVSLSDSNNNLIYHNNFIDNSEQAYDNTGTNSWDNGPTEGGNYWSDRSCIGNPSDGSLPYSIDTDSIDRYPFQDPNRW